MSKEKIAELKKCHRSFRDKRQADRVKAVIALSKGWSAAQVAEILLFDEKTSRHYFERYRQDGLQALHLMFISMVFHITIPTSALERAGE